MTTRAKDVLAAARSLAPKERALVVAELQRPGEATTADREQTWFDELESRIADVARGQEVEDAEAAGHSLRAELDR